MKKEHLLWGLGGLLIGYMAANQLRKVPVVNKLPSF